MSRLDKERQNELQPKRMELAIDELTQLGFDVSQKGEGCISFMFKESEVLFYPYSGWHTGKSIKDGRGLNNLLKQLL